MPVWDGVEDSQLLRIAQNGEAEAFGVLYERHAKAIFRFLYARLDSRPDAEDLTEEVFLRFWRALSTYEDKGIPLSAFLFRVANNALVDHYRRSKHSAPGISLEDDWWLDERPGPAETTAINLEHQDLRQALGELREDYRDVLILRFLSELSPTETAQVMNRSVGAVRILQHRALTAIRKTLESVQNKKNGR